MKINAAGWEKLAAIRNDNVNQQLEYFTRICKPSKVTILNESKEDIEYIRRLVITSGEEIPLKIKGHTVHFDGYYDLARDKSSTKVLTPPGMQLSRDINRIDRDIGLKEVLSLVDGAMNDKEMLVKFYTLGPTNSKFSLGTLQISDSPYVIHSEDILYRQGYEHFKSLKGSNNFFTFIHSAGELNGLKVTKNVDKRRIYIDLIDGKVYS
ncbi:phosphoenolpyruvate carboxykinase (GTP), partial [Candidatus Bathyarchaeota archaeon]|nr:phosphoenolpyruvate carboxykinase (GTP) [Candidatus Bathyarchaeota archaeon]